MIRKMEKTRRREEEVARSLRTQRDHNHKKCNRKQKEGRKHKGS